MINVDAVVLGNSHTNISGVNFTYAWSHTDIHTNNNNNNNNNKNNNLFSPEIICV
jgi:hypothetical protein